MTRLQDETLETLRRRIEALEAEVQRARATQRRRTGGNVLAMGCVAALAVALAGGAIAEPDLGELAKLIRKGPDGTTQVSAPFDVVDDGGRVILSVGTANKGTAAVTIVKESGRSGGVVVVNSERGIPLVSVGTHDMGYGVVAVQDSQGKLRGLVSGNGGLVAFNKAGKQVAGAVVTDEDKGKVGIWTASGSQSIVDLTEDATGAGAVTTYDKAQQKIVSVGANADGKGSVEVWTNNRAVATLASNSMQAGELYLRRSDGTLGAGASAATKPGFGGFGVFTREGKEAASMVLTQENTGRVAVFGIDQVRIVEMAEDTSGAGVVRLLNTQKELAATMGTVDGTRGNFVVWAKEKAVANLQSTPASEGEMLLTTSDGKDRVLASGGPNVNGLAVLDDGGKVAASLTLSPENQGRIAVSNNDKEAAVLTLDGSDAGVLRVANKAGDGVATIGSTTNGKGLITLQEQDKPAVQLEATASGGEVSTYSTQGDKVASMLSDQGGKGHITIQSKKQVIGGLGEGPSGTAVMYVKNKSHKVVASMGVDTDSGGAVVAANASGINVSQMDATGTGYGRFAVFSPGTEQPIAVLTRANESSGGLLQITNGKTAVVSIGSGTTNAGYMQLTNQSGLPAIEAAMAPSGVGVVRAGPRFKCQGKLMSAAIPDCIIGIQ